MARSKTASSCASEKVLERNHVSGRSIVEIALEDPSSGGEDHIPGTGVIDQPLRSEPVQIAVRIPQREHADGQVVNHERRDE